MNLHFLDRLPGPTHAFTGLARGNPHAKDSRFRPSNPRQAAHESLQKARTVTKTTNVTQHLLPPQPRPDLETLRDMGFTGSDEEILSNVHQQDPELLYRSSSSSFMWMANAGHATPSFLSKDGRLHVTPANLTSHLHRRLELPDHTEWLHRLLDPVDDAVVHDPLPSAMETMDEGQANRIFLNANSTGVELSVYGREMDEPVSNPLPRQTDLACRSVIRRHQLTEQHAVIARQNQSAIESGIFHNDVIAFGRGNIFITHESAYENQESVIQSLQKTFQRATDRQLNAVVIKNSDLDLEQAVESYLFNSQLLPSEDGLILLASERCREGPANDGIQKIVRETPVESVEYVSLEESLSNGGGPACMTLELPLSEAQAKQIPSTYQLTESRLSEIEDWIDQHYPTHLTHKNLADPKLLSRSRKALNDFTAYKH